MSRCTAPVKGHRSLGSTANCPVHGLGPMSADAKRAASKPPSLYWTDLRNESAAIRLGAAKRPTADAQTLAALAGDSDRDVRMAVAIHTNTPTDVLALMAEVTSPDSDSSIYRALVENPNSPLILMESAAEDEWYALRRSAARNPSTPQYVLRRLATDGDRMCIRHVADNPSAPEDALRSLATDHDATIRAAVARNPSLPDDALAAMVDDEETSVRVNAREAVTMRLCERLDVPESNTAAIEALREQAWWEMTPGSDAVTITLALHPNT